MTWGEPLVSCVVVCGIVWHYIYNHVLMQEFPRANGSQRWASLSGVALHCCSISTDRPGSRSQRLPVDVSLFVVLWYCHFMFEDCNIS